MAIWGRDLYAVIFAVSFVTFAVNFFVSWGVSAYLFRRVWPRFLIQEKADWASRVNSQLHAFIVVPGFLATLSTTKYNYDTWFNDDANIVPSSVIMSISLGYFAFDFLVLVYYRVPLWIVFVFHHIFASVPYFTYVFHPCEAGNLVLSAFLLVEAATIFLNFQTWMEKLGYARTKWFTWMFYLTYISWFLTRVLLPVFLCYVVWNVWLSDITVDRNLRPCLAPGFVCSHMITLFCWVVFFFVLTPDVVRRWKETPEAVEERLQDAQRRRRSHITSRDHSRANSPIASSAGRRTAHPTGTPEPHAPELDAGHEGGREPLDFDVETNSRRHDEEVVEEVEPVGDGPIDYEALLHTMLSDNPYRSRPEGRTELRDLSLEELRREGISIEHRTTAYATTTIRL